MTCVRRKVIVVGAGGHARVILSLLSYRPEFELVGIIDRTPDTIGEVIGSANIVASFDQLAGLYEQGIQAVALALGDNAERAAMFEKLRRMGFDVLSLIHPQAIVERDVRLGEGTVICAESD